jgi:ribosomal protein L37AE/L43A
MINGAMYRKLDEMELSEVHDCEKCHGKIVCISVDNVGVTRCGYCNAVVDYGPYYQNLYKDEVLELINRLRLEKLEKEATKKWQKKKQKKKRKRKDRLVETLW